MMYLLHLSNEVRLMECDKTIAVFDSEDQYDEWCNNVGQMFAYIAQQPNPLDWTKSCGFLPDEAEEIETLYSFLQDQGMNDREIEHFFQDWKDRGPKPTSEFIESVKRGDFNGRGKEF